MKKKIKYSTLKIKMPESTTKLLLKGIIGLIYILIILLLG